VRADPAPTQGPEHPRPEPLVEPLAGGRIAGLHAFDQLAIGVRLTRGHRKVRRWPDSEGVGS
jgi:hypothetical protein